MAKKKNSKDASINVAQIEAMRGLFTDEQIKALKAIAIGNTGATVASTDETREQRIEQITKKNNEIIKSIPQDKRQQTRNLLTRLHKAGYPCARLQRNKKHQLDACKVFAGEKINGTGRGREPEFIACQTEAGKKISNQRKDAYEHHKPYPPIPDNTYYYSPTGGGCFIARGVFGPQKN